jgi:CheY-like chemotaxis protein
LPPLTAPTPDVALLRAKPVQRADSSRDGLPSRNIGGPRMRGKRSGVHEATDTAPSSTRSRRILVVDDDPSNARVIALMCGLGGYEVHWADSGVAAMALLAREGVDLVLLDVHMPIVDGPGTLRLLRNSRDLAEMPVVFLTGTVLEEERARLGALGAAAVLQKPIRRVDLLRCLANLMPAE